MVSADRVARTEIARLADTRARADLIASVLTRVLLGDTELTPALIESLVVTAERIVADTARSIAELEAVTP